MITLTKVGRDELVRYTKRPTEREIRAREAFLTRAKESTAKNVKKVNGKTIFTLNVEKRAY